MRAFFQALPVVGRLFQDIKPEEVRGLWRHLQGVYNTKIVTKGDALEMKLIGGLLDAIGVKDQQDFLENFATTLGRNIYLPFTVGVPSGEFDLWNQVKIAVHEHTHVMQHDEEGVRYEALYLTNRASRARYEAEAYRCNLEMDYWRKKAFSSTAHALAGKLRHYGCSAEDEIIAEHSLRLAMVSIEQGAILSPVTKQATDWLAEHAPRLKAR